MAHTGRQFSRWVVVILILLLTGCGATAIDIADPKLVGSWHGECVVNLPIVFDPAQRPDDVEPVGRAVKVDITIHEDAAVEGMVGEATLQASTLKRNRGELGRKLNVASDYIIIDGHLASPIVAGEDDTDMKSFTIPFDLIDDRIQGGIMWRQVWKYPYPLCGVELTRLSE